MPRPASGSSATGEDQEPGIGSRFDHPGSPAKGSVGGRRRYRRCQIRRAGLRNVIMPGRPDAADNGGLTFSG
jgi:hypothetical protein